MKTKLLLSSTLPQQFSFQNSVLIYDKKLEKFFSGWIRKFEKKYAVTAGEKLKDAKYFYSHVEKLHQLCRLLGKNELQVVAFGGGSVGDFAGLFASLYRRGTKLIHVPSTWLAALDSSHGGKTALNIQGSKNQLGTFYCAEQTIVCHEVLLSLGDQRFYEASAEATKVALLQGGKLYKKMSQVRNVHQLMPLLPDLIAAKLKIVRRDPEEKNGIRQLLNLGHTMGHVFESSQKIPHGKAVSLGLRFAIEWSAHLQGAAFNSELIGIATKAELWQALKGLRDVQKLLLQDKKSTAKNKLRFIFLNKPGDPFIQEVSVKEILNEIKRQVKSDV